MSSTYKVPPIGALRRRLILEALDPAPDGAGGLTGNWSAIATIWGAVHARSGLEALSGDGDESRVTHDIWVRPRADIAPAHRLRLGDGRIFNIRAVLRQDEYVNRLRLICELRNQ